MPTSTTTGKVGPPSRFRLPFGRHRGRLLSECPTDYLIWLADEADSPTLRRLARQALDLQEDPDEDPTEPRKDAAATVLPHIVWQWQRAMRDEYGDNPPAVEVIDRGQEILQQLCSNYTHKPWPAEGAA
jgi:uncharacterized protein (DUF3820 family)